MKGRYYSRIDPEYRFNIDDPIIVTVDKNDLESKYYVSEVIEALKNRGFRNVYSHGNQEDYQGTFKGIQSRWGQFFIIDKTVTMKDLTPRILLNWQRGI